MLPFITFKFNFIKIQHNTSFKIYLLLIFHDIVCAIFIVIFYSCLNNFKRLEIVTLSLTSSCLHFCVIFLHFYVDIVFIFIQISFFCFVFTFFFMLPCFYFSVEYIFNECINIIEILTLTELIYY